VDYDLNKQAIEFLQLLTIKLHDSLLERDDEFIRGETEFTPALQAMQHTKSVRLNGVDADGERIEILRVFIRFGVRGIKDVEQPVDRDDDPESVQDEEQSLESMVLFRLEATFRADYQLTGEVSKEALQEFIRYNATHNVWPFWRQHVFDVVSRAELTEIQVGLFPARK
jgi:hypothetical protein